ncbi:MAG: DUF5050 domain-containing protein [Armatimonadetes bacterium]|nr:DUF5050 domain-containing protein [Armatimonadota bacterium]
MINKVILKNLLILNILILFFLFACGAPKNARVGDAFIPNGAGTIQGSASSGGTTTTTAATGVSTLYSNAVSPYDIETDGTYVYWSEKVGSSSGKIRRIKADGTESSPTDLATGLNYPSGITLSGGYVYFTQYVGSAGGYISKISASTSGTASTVASSVTNPAFCKIYNNEVYFTENQGSSSGTLKKVSTSGGTITTLTSSLNNPFSLEIDPNNGDVYFTEFVGSSSGKIKRYSGGSVTEIATGLTYPADLALDTSGTSVVIYWTEWNGNSGLLRKKTVGSSTITDISTNTPFGILRLSGYIYFGENLNSAIVKRVSASSFSSSNVSNLSTSEAYPFQFTGSGSSIYWTEYPYDSGGQPLRIRKYTF